jgi:hypothetical protein
MPMSKLKSTIVEYVISLSHQLIAVEELEK